MKLVFIHGRGQQKIDKNDLKEVWISTLKKGLDKSGLSLPKNIKIEFPYYGDLLEELSNSSANKKLAENIIARGEENYVEASFYYDLVTEIAENADITGEDIEKNYVPNMKEKGPLNWGWVQAILTTLDQTFLGSWSIEKFTNDVFLYLTKPGIQNKINEYVSESLDGEKCVVVGHSLGSIVGFNILRKKKDAFVTKYVTVGSPLGLEAIKSKLESPILMPESIIEGKWFNAYDDRDCVALNPLNKKHFNVEPAIVNKSNVNNETKNRHGIIGYLNDSEVAKVIYDALHE